MSYLYGLVGTAIIYINAFVEVKFVAQGTDKAVDPGPGPPDPLARNLLSLGHQRSGKHVVTQGNLLKGFDNYISLKTSKIQAVQKKLKV